MEVYNDIIEDQPEAPAGDFNLENKKKYGRIRRQVQDW